MFPYRVVTALQDVALGSATYNARKNKGNVGWSQDVLDAALLGLGVEAATMVAQRSAQPPIPGQRWLAFQDGAGGTDHGAVNNAALRLMLVNALANIHCLSVSESICVCVSFSAVMLRVSAGAATSHARFEQTSAAFSMAV